MKLKSRHVAVKREPAATSREEGADFSAFLHSFPALLRYIRVIDQAAFLQSVSFSYVSSGVAFPRVE
jgi:hypothetical protein